MFFIMQDEMGGAFGSVGEKGKCIKGFYAETWREETTWKTQT